MPGLFNTAAAAARAGMIAPNYTNWLQVSAGLDHQNDPHVRMLDQAIKKYAAERSQYARIFLAGTIYQWWDSPLYQQNLNVNDEVSAKLLTRLARDVGDNTATITAQSIVMKKPSIPSTWITIPLTSYANHSIVAVVTQLTDCYSRIAQVEGALREIASRPLGAKLLEGINARQQGQWPFVVKIKCAETNNNTNPVKNEHVTNTTVAWSPDMEASNDGYKRPAYIALAHELIHAYHYATGVNFGGDAEEAATVGLRDWWIDPQSMDSVAFKYPFTNPQENEFLAGRSYGPTLHITENLIRHEHGWPLRLVYTNKIYLSQTPSALAYAKAHKSDHKRELTTDGRVG